MEAANPRMPYCSGKKTRVRTGAVAMMTARPTAVPEARIAVPQNELHFALTSQRCHFGLIDNSRPVRPRAVRNRCV
jgi:hypothetical protein